LRLHLATLYDAGWAQRLVEAFGDARSVFTTPRDQLRKTLGRRRRALRRLEDLELARLADRELREAERRGVTILFRGSASFPAVLEPLPMQPLVLFCRGAWQTHDELALGVVGSRKPSVYARQQAERFSEGLATLGVTVVSGLARGVDISSHRAALDAGGRTIAVLGSGLGRLYPPEHAGVAESIVRDGRGALISEFPFEAAPKSFHFPQRNRVLSALSRVLLVAEAGIKSGSLITVRWALEQGKTVFVIPGRIDREEARGGLELLRDGAGVALGPEDLHTDLGLLVPPEKGSESAVEPATSPLPGPLGRALEELFAEQDVWTTDSITERVDMPAPQLLGELSRLELGEKLHRSPCGGYARGRAR